MLLVATVIWLIYVLSNNIGIKGGIFATIISLLFFAALKIKVKILKNLSLVTLAISMMILPASFENNEKAVNPADMIWIKFNENQLHRLVDEGNVVVVDVTADWCITCKFNKLRVFHDADVMKKIQQDKVFAMRADITKPNEEVLQFIHKKGRYAIPFNAVYGPKAPEGLLTSELLSKEELFKLIDQASKN
jgi:suppressor for copper-sensitivity B